MKEELWAVNDAVCKFGLEDDSLLVRTRKRRTTFMNGAGNGRRARNNCDDEWPGMEDDEAGEDDGP